MNHNPNLEVEEQVRNDSIKAVMDDIRSAERALLGDAVYNWLQSIGIVK